MVPKWIQFPGEGSSCVEFVELYRKNAGKHGLTPFYMEFGWAQARKAGLVFGGEHICAIYSGTDTCPGYQEYITVFFKRILLFLIIHFEALPKVQNKLLPTGTHTSFILGSFLFPHL